MSISTQVYVHTLGCPKNEADSRGLVQKLTAAGVTVTSDPARASHVVVNTCGFIQDAKEESIAAILDACARYGGSQVVVTGCLVERYRQELEQGLPEVAQWFGLTEGERLVNWLGQLSPENAVPARLAQGTVTDLPPTSTPSNPPLASELATRSSTVSSYAYVKISDGCDELCSFCAIPAIKGPYYPVPPSAILADVEACLRQGAREIVLVGQDTAVWAYEDMQLPGLIDLIAADKRVCRIRLLYLQPEHVTTALLEYMAGQPKLCRYLDLPFQHADKDILQRMNRWGSGADYLDLLGQARRLMPDVSVRSTFIVGFPGESPEQFETLLDFVRAAAFDHAGGFVYSPEEGTVAATLRPRVRRAVARERLNQLTSLLEQVAEKQHASLLGQQVQVMIDGWDETETGERVVAIGRTAGQAPEIDGITYIEGELPAGTQIGDIVTVSITDVIGYDLVGHCDMGKL